MKYILFGILIFFIGLIFPIEFSPRINGDASAISEYLTIIFISITYLTSIIATLLIAILDELKKINIVKKQGKIYVDEEDFNLIKQSLNLKGSVNEALNDNNDISKK